MLLTLTEESLSFLALVSYVIRLRKLRCLSPELLLTRF